MNSVKYMAQKIVYSITTCLYGLTISIPEDFMGAEYELLLFSLILDAFGFVGFQCFNE